MIGLKISKFIMEAIVRTADPITWKSETPVCVGQWLLTSEKLSAATALVQEQLEEGHIELSNSPWNTPIFVIKKNLGIGDCCRTLEQ